MNLNMNLNMPTSLGLPPSFNTGGANRPPPPELGELSGYAVEAKGNEATIEFMHEFMNSSISGEFDAESLVQSAPESLLTYAKNNGVPLQEMLTQAHEQLQSFGNNSRLTQATNSMAAPSQTRSLASNYLANTQLSSNHSMINNLFSTLTIRQTA